MLTPYYSDDAVTIYHGDCHAVREWLEADVLVTDPPYGMSFRSSRGGSFGTSEIAADDSVQARDAALLLWGDRPGLVFGRWSVPRPGATRALLTWEKGEHVGMGDLSLPWKPNTEEVYVLGTGFEGRRGSSVLRHLAIAGTVGQAADGSRRHPTEKPVGLMTDLLTRTPAHWTIADPFMGSGSTLRAAKDLGRKAIGIELEERYCEVAARRMCQEVFDLGEAA